MSIADCRHEWKHTACTVCLVCLVGVLAIARSGHGPTRSAEIDVMVSLTGARHSSSRMKAIQAAQTVVNADGGVGGRPVNFVANDDGSNPQTALQLANASWPEDACFWARNLRRPAVLLGVDRSGRTRRLLLVAALFIRHALHVHFGCEVPSISHALMRYLRERGLTRVASSRRPTHRARLEAASPRFFALPENKSFQVVANEHSTRPLECGAQVARLKATTGSHRVGLYRCTDDYITSRRE